MTFAELLESLSGWLTPYEPERFREFGFLRVAALDPNVFLAAGLPAEFVIEGSSRNAEVAIQNFFAAFLCDSLVNRARSELEKARRVSVVRALGEGPFSFQTFDRTFRITQIARAVRFDSLVSSFPRRAFHLVEIPLGSPLEQFRVERDRQGRLVDAAVEHLRHLLIENGFGAQIAFHDRRRPAGEPGTGVSIVLSNFWVEGTEAHVSFVLGHVPATGRREFGWCAVSLTDGPTGISIAPVARQSGPRAFTPRSAQWLGQDWEWWKEADRIGSSEHEESYAGEDISLLQPRPELLERLATADVAFANAVRGGQYFASRGTDPDFIKLIWLGCTLDLDAFPRERDALFGRPPWSIETFDRWWMLESCGRVCLAADRLENLFDVGALSLVELEGDYYSRMIARRRDEEDFFERTMSLAVERLQAVGAQGPFYLLGRAGRPVDLGIVSRLAEVAPVRSPGAILATPRTALRIRSFFSGRLHKEVAVAARTTHADGTVVDSTVEIQFEKKNDAWVPA